MTDQRVGAAFRAVRTKRGWRQLDVGLRSGVSISVVSLIERGRLERVSLRVLRKVAAVLDIRLDVIARWQGGELDRLLSARHGALAEAFAGWLRAIGAWDVLPEVSFAIWGERGSIDLLAWHAPTRTLLVIEIKTELVDVGDLLSVMDRKVRLAPEIGAGRGWRPRRVAALVVFADGSTNRRHVAQHATLLRAAFPADGRQMRDWLRGPAPEQGRVAGLMFFSDSTTGRGKRGHAPARRVRVPTCPPAERGATRGTSGKAPDSGLAVG